MRGTSTLRLFVIAVAMGLALGAILGSGCAGTSNAGPGPGPVTVDVSATGGSAFSPSTVTVSPGDTVRWTNHDSIPHTVTSDAANAPAGGPGSDSQYSGGIPAGQTYSWTAPAGAASGTHWYYHCRFHGAPGDGAHQGTGMAGTITVQ